jgi:hypothetical protein
MAGRPARELDFKGWIDREWDMLDSYRESANPVALRFFCDVDPMDIWLECPSKSLRCSKRRLTKLILDLSRVYDGTNRSCQFDLWVINRKFLQESPWGVAMLEGFDRGETWFSQAFRAAGLAHPVDSVLHGEKRRIARREAQLDALGDNLRRFWREESLKFKKRPGETRPIQSSGEVEAEKGGK